MNHRKYEFLSASRKGCQRLVSKEGHRQRVVNQARKDGGAEGGGVFGGGDARAAHPADSRPAGASYQQERRLAALRWALGTPDRGALQG